MALQFLKTGQVPLLRRLDNTLNMTSRLSGHFSISGLVFFVLKFLWELSDNGVVKKLQFFDAKALESC